MSCKRTIDNGTFLYFALILSLISIQSARIVLIFNSHQTASEQWALVKNAQQQLGFEPQPLSHKQQCWPFLKRTTKVLYRGNKHEIYSLETFLSHLANNPSGLRLKLVVKCRAYPLARVSGSGWLGWSAHQVMGQETKRGLQES